MNSRNIIDSKTIKNHLDNMILAVLPICDYQSALIGNEAKIANKLSEQRKAEFIAGRNISRMLLDELNISNVDIGRNINGSPIWPDGVCGSISHKYNYCAVLLGKKGAIEEVGVDLEYLEELKKGIWKTFTSDKELEGIDCPEMSYGERANLIFSAKEAAYKCFSNNRKYQEITFENIQVKANLINSLISTSCKYCELLSHGVVLKSNRYLISCTAKNV